MPIYNKLVRDKIPEIIAAEGKKCIYRTLDPDEFKRELRRKMDEELAEFDNSKDKLAAIEELCDLLEIIYSLAETLGANREVLEMLRQQKAKTRGTFQFRYLLESVQD